MVLLKTMYTPVRITPMQNSAGRPFPFTHVKLTPLAAPALADPRKVRYTPSDHSAAFCAGVMDYVKDAGNVLLLTKNSKFNETARGVYNKVAELQRKYYDIDFVPDALVAQHLQGGQVGAVITWQCRALDELYFAWPMVDVPDTNAGAGKKIDPTVQMYVRCLTVDDRTWMLKHLQRIPVAEFNPLNMVSDMRKLRTRDAMKQATQSAPTPSAPTPSALQPTPADKGKAQADEWQQAHDAGYTNSRYGPPSTVDLSRSAKTIMRTRR
jgi:hypothetical protein